MRADDPDSGAEAREPPLPQSAGERLTNGLCPQCGAALPPDAPQGFCPACLVRLGTGWESPVSDSETTEPARKTPPLATTAGLGSSPMVFGGYELLEELGRGGMGVVYSKGVTP